MLSNFYGFKIKANRERLKLTVDQFAKRLGVSRATQMNYENGRTLPSVAYLDECAKIGIDPMDLLHAGVAFENVNNLDPEGIAAQVFRMIDSPAEPLDTPAGRAWLFERALRLIRRLKAPGL